MPTAPKTNLTSLRWLRAAPSAMGRVRGAPLWIGAASAVLLIGSACGGSSNSARATAEPGTTDAASPTPAAATPSTGVEINGSTYRLLKKGYAFTAPDGWTANPDYFNDIAGSQFPTDVLFLSGATGDATPTIAIACLKPNADEQTTAAFRDARVAFNGQIGKAVAPPRAVRMGDQDAYAIDYEQELTQSNPPVVLEKTDAVAVVGACRWLVTLSAARGQRAAHAAEFSSLLRSLTFFPLH